MSTPGHETLNQTVSEFWRAGSCWRLPRWAICHTIGVIMSYLIAKPTCCSSHLPGTAHMNHPPPKSPSYNTREKSFPLEHQRRGCIWVLIQQELQTSRAHFYLFQHWPTVAGARMEAVKSSRALWWAWCKHHGVVGRYGTLRSCLWCCQKASRSHQHTRIHLNNNRHHQLLYQTDCKQQPGC